MNQRFMAAANDFGVVEQEKLLSEFFPLSLTNYEAYAEWKLAP